MQIVILSKNRCDPECPIINASTDEKQDVATGKQSLLWKISSGEKVSYVFGTIHIPYKGFEKLQDPLLDAMKSCDSFYTEMEPDEKNQVEISRGMLLSPDQSLKVLVGDELFEKTAKIAEKFDPPISATFLNGKKIWGAVLIISYPRMSYDLALDVLLYQKAKLLGKKTVGIETPEEQVKSLDSFTKEEQIEMLKDSIQEAEGGFKTVNLVLKLYLEQNIQEMMKTFTGKDDGFPPDFKKKYLKVLLCDRNRLFFERLKGQFEKENTFVAVGAGHLVGKDNLLELLENAGFRVDPVKFSFPPGAISASKEILKFLDLDK